MDIVNVSFNACIMTFAHDTWVIVPTENIP